MTPRERVRAACDRRGGSAVVAGCVDLLEGREVDDDLVLTLGGAPAEHVLGGGEGGRTGYWPRVWAARGLLHAWDDRVLATGAPDVLHALRTAAADDSWRVREMAAKVVARHRVADAFEAVLGLQDDPVPRVRAAAGRALTALAAARV